MPRAHVAASPSCQDLRDELRIKRCPFEGTTGCPLRSAPVEERSFKDRRTLRAQAYSRYATVLASCCPCGKHLADVRI